MFSIVTSLLSYLVVNSAFLFVASLMSSIEIVSSFSPNSLVVTLKFGQYHFHLKY